MAHDIFISYSTKNKPVADAVCARMENGGLRCWYAPRDIEPGADWADSIIRAIDGARIMVLIFTEDSNVSRQVLREVNYAVGAGVTIIPLRLTKEDPIARMKYYLSAVHWIDALDQDLEVSIEELYRTCKAFIDTAPVNVVPEAISSEKTRTKKKTGIIAACAAAAALAVICIIVFGPGEQSDVQYAAEAEEAAFSPADETSGGSAESDGSADTEDKGNPDAPIGSLSANAGKELASVSEGNTMCCLNAGGYMAYDDGWYYFRSNDDYKLYKMREDGSGVTKLSDHQANCISVYDGYVYYNVDYQDIEDDMGIYRVDQNGENEIRIWYNNVWFLFIKDNALYFVDGSELYYIDLDTVGDDFDSFDLTSDEIRIGAFPEDNYPYTCCFDDEHIYYVNMEDNYLYRSGYDASDIELLLDHAISGRTLTIAGDVLYFYDEETENVGYYDLSTDTYAILYDGDLSCMNITGDGIFCSGDNGELEFVDPSTGEITYYQKDHNTYDVCVAGNKIFFEELQKYYVINKDGNNRIEL